MPTRNPSPGCARCTWVLLHGTNSVSWSELPTWPGPGNGNQGPSLSLLRGPGCFIRERSGRKQVPWAAGAPATCCCWKLNNTHKWTEGRTPTSAGSCESLLAFCADTRTEFPGAVGLWGLGWQLPQLSQPFQKPPVCTEARSPPPPAKSRRKLSVRPSEGPDLPRPQPLCSPLGRPSPRCHQQLQGVPETTTAGRQHRQKCFRIGGWG